MMVRVRAAVFALLVALLLLPAVASAHAELVSSSPEDGAILAASPALVRLSFSEPIEPDFGVIEVYAADRTRVDRANVRVPADDIAALEVDLPPLAEGTYTVAWRVLSIDSHVVQGQFTFSVGTPSASGAALDIPTRSAPLGVDATVRWWTFMFAFVLAGGLAFLPLVWWPALAAANLMNVPAMRRVERTTIWLVWASLVALFLISLAALVVQAANASGVGLGEVLGGRALSRLLISTKYGTLWLLRMACLFALLLVVATMTVRMRIGRWQAAAGVGVGALLLLTISASGHASSVVRGTAVAIAADWLHMAAAAIWTGGLLQLLLVLPVVRSLGDARRRVLGKIVQRFSWTAGANVAALVATGVYAGVVHVPTMRSLGYTEYGAALSGKLMLVVVLLGIGAVNLLVMHPRFLRLMAGKNLATEDATRRLFRRLVAGEALIVVAVLAVTGILTGLPPATTAPGTGLPFAATETAADLRISLSVTPNQAGTNRIEALVVDRAGQPVDVPDMVLTLDHIDMTMDERRAELQPEGAGRYAVEGTYLNMPGRWNGSVTLPTGGAAATFQWTVGELPTSAPTLSPGLILLNAATPLAAVGVIAFALAALVLVKRAGWQRVRDRRQALWIGGFLLLLGTLTIGNTVATAYRRTLPNPVEASLANVAQGRQLYATNCATCHGLTGRGDGPAGVRLDPRPADFQVHMREGHTDRQLFDWITSGVDGTAMPGFGQTMSEDEIWTVINFLHTFGPQQP